MKTLIISENQTDSQTLRKVIRNIIPKSIIVTAVNKTQATEIVCNDGPFAFYIVDADIKSFKVDSVLTTITELSGIKPTLFTGHETSFNSIIDQETYDAHQSNQFIPKPYEHKNFRKSLEEKLKAIIDWVNSQNNEHSIEQIDPKDFIPMKIKSFFLCNEFAYDIYLEITNTRYLKLLPANTKYGHSFLANYARKNVKYLHIKKDDHIKYLEEEMNLFLDQFKRNLVQDDPFILLLRSTTVFHQYLKALGVTEKSSKLLEYMVKYIIELQKSFSNINDLLDSYPYYYEGISSKSLLTAFISTYVGRKLNWDSEMTKRKLIAAAILQDYALDDEALSKVTNLKDSYLKELSKEQVDLFKAHPIKAALIADQFGAFPDISFIVVNQHELPDRKGFPNKPLPSMFSKLTYVFNISTHIAAKIDGQSPDSISVQDILRLLKKNYYLANGKEILEVFKKAFS